MNLQSFSKQHHLRGITPHTLSAIHAGKPGYSVNKARQFMQFYQRIKKELLHHPVITRNRYTAWFSRGEMTHEQLKAFIVQFSVFSNLFIVAQLLKTINADSPQSMHASKEILVNELGVVFNHPDKHTKDDLVSAEGTVEGGNFHFAAAHFEWLYKTAAAIGLDYKEIGKRRHGTKSTLFYCDELARLYANEDYTISQASSFAVENWAAAGFWKELIQGLEVFQHKHAVQIPIFFFTYHDRIEDQHAQHTLDELEDMYFDHDTSENINEDKFIKYGNEMLNGVEIFWKGLDAQRNTMTTH